MKAPAGGAKIPSMNWTNQPPPNCWPGQISPQLQLHPSRLLPRDGRDELPPSHSPLLHSLATRPESRLTATAVSIVFVHTTPRCTALQRLARPRLRTLHRRTRHASLTTTSCCDRNVTTVSNTHSAQLLLRQFANAAIHSPTLPRCPISLSRYHSHLKRVKGCGLLRPTSPQWPPSHQPRPQ